MTGKQTKGQGLVVKRNNGRWMVSATVDGQRLNFYGTTQKKVSEKLDNALQNTGKKDIVKKQKNEEKKPRRSKGEGSIYQRPDGTWTAQVTTGRDPKTGKIIRRTFYGKSRGVVAKN